MAEVEYAKMCKPDGLVITRDPKNGNILWTGLTHGIYEQGPDPEPGVYMWLTADAGKMLEKTDRVWEWQPNQDKINAATPEGHASKLYDDRFHIDADRPIDLVFNLPELGTDTTLPKGVKMGAQQKGRKYCCFEHDNNKYILLWENNYKKVLDEILYVHLWALEHKA